METGQVVRFASETHPFQVETAPCLDLDCPCSIMTLTLSELVPPGGSPGDRLTFTLRVCLKTWLERDPPPRSLEVESLVHEFLGRFPSGRIQELAAEFERTRAAERRLKSLSFSGSRDELVTYANVLNEQGGVREGLTDEAYFFMFEGREFLVEDHYCANPECDCREVHLEFWEKVHEVYRQGSVAVLDLGAGQVRKGTVWTYCGQREVCPYLIYDYWPTGEGEAPRQFLQGYEGYLADAASVFDQVYLQGTVLEVACGAHMRRYFYKARNSAPREAHRAVAYFRQLSWMSFLGRLQSKRMTLSKTAKRPHHIASAILGRPKTVRLLILGDLRGSFSQLALHPRLQFVCVLEDSSAQSSSRHQTS